MNELLTDPAMGGLLSLLPTPAAMIAGTIFNLIGLFIYFYARRQKNRRLKWVAIALFIYPLFVDETWLICVLGALLCVLAWIWRHPENQS